MVLKGLKELQAEVIDTGLCVNCGACQNLCPYWLSHKGRTYNLFSCSRETGLCYAFCPRTETNISDLSAKFFDKNSIVAELGPFKDLLLTRATNSEIRSKSQHGGTVTALVELALKEGYIDAAVMTRSEGGINPQSVLISNPRDVQKCSGSSFQISPTISILNQALKENQYKKIGVVGAPCQTMATYKIKAMPFVENHNNAENIGIVFGLFCGWGLDWSGLEQLVTIKAGDSKLKRIDIPPSKYSIMELETMSEKIEVPLEQVNPIVKTPCNYCLDMTAEFSDLSIGGARSSEGWEVDRGWNQVIVRSELGENLIKLAKDKGVLEFRNIEKGTLDKLKKASLNKKIKALKAIINKTGQKNDLLYLNPDDSKLQDILSTVIAKEGN